MEPIPVGHRQRRTAPGADGVGHVGLTVEHHRIGGRAIDLPGKGINGRVGGRHVGINHGVKKGWSNMHIENNVTRVVDQRPGSKGCRCSLQSRKSPDEDSS